MSPSRRQFTRQLLALGAGGALASIGARAAERYPARPVRMIVPFPPGGAVDYYARIVQAPVSDVLGQPLVIDNRAGASGMIGSELVVKSPPDGYTILLGNIACLAINSGIYAHMTYDPARDFTPIIHTDDINYVLVVNATLPVRTVPELIAYAKAHPGALSYGSAGSGSLPQLAVELFKRATGTDFIHVPYKGGGPMVTDLIAGQTQLTIADQANLMPHVTSGKLRALAVSSPKRSASYPDLPTIAETIPGFEATAWNGVVGPVGLPADVVDTLNAAFNKVMTDANVKKRMQEGGLDPVGGTPQAFGAFIASEKAKWGKVAHDVGAKAD
ncbi:MAG: tripartite tricarboxylate transporter substrate binding protein [Proteobacteria bacterium]|nr:tripartite tricarboxylate transporter substrate binding protein [Pseudomonadota bacterium]